MLLEFIPPSPTLPSFRLFIDFADFTHGHPNPLAWTSQLSTLLQHELDLPRSMHMFDKAVGLTTLLESVSFDLRSAARNTIGDDGTAFTNVRCEFVDGNIVEWAIPLDSTNWNFDGDNTSSSTSPFFKTLQTILKDVRSLRSEEERAKLAVQYERQQLQRQNSVGISSSTPSSVGPSLARRFTVGVMRHSNSMPSMSSEVPIAKSHKRQRSFLRGIVSAVGSIVSSKDSTNNRPLNRPFTATSSDSGQSRPLSLQLSGAENSETKQSPSNSLRSNLPHHNPQLDQQQEEPFISSSSTHQARAQFHRERVRAGLVDAYRRFVLAGLAAGVSSSSAVFLTASVIEESNSVPESVDEEDDEDLSTVHDTSSEASEGEEPEVEEKSHIDRDASSTSGSRKRRPPTPSVPAPNTSLTRRTHSRANSNATSSSHASSRDPYAPGKRELYSYYTWVLKSMLRRTEEEMEKILKECEEERKREIEQERLEEERERIRQELFREDNGGAPVANDARPSSATPALKRSPSKLFKKRSESVSFGTSPAPSKFSLGNFMKRKKLAPIQSSNHSAPTPNSSPVSPIFVPVSEPPTPTSFSSTPLPSPRRLVHFALAADSDDLLSSHDDSGRFSPTTMDVPSSFSDSDSDEGDDRRGEGDALPMPAGDLAVESSVASSTRSEWRTSTTSSTSTSTTSSSGHSSETATNDTVDTAVTTPSSSPPLPSLPYTGPEGQSQEQEGASEQEEAEAAGEGEVIQYGYAVTCDGAVSVEEGCQVPFIQTSVALVNKDAASSKEEVECATFPAGIEREDHSSSDASTILPVFSLQQPVEASEPDIPSRLESNLYMSSSRPNPKPTKPFILPASYNRLLDLTHKLRSLLIHATLSSQAIKEEEEKNMQLLEVRGKRRAWSNGAYVRGVRNMNSSSSQRRAEILVHAKERAAVRKTEWEARARSEKRKKRRTGKGWEGEDEEGETPRSRESFSRNINRELPALPVLALSTPFRSSPLSLFVYTAEEKEEKEGLVYVCPVKEQTVFYRFLNPLSSAESGIGIITGSTSSSRRRRLNMDGLDRSVVSTRELRVRRSHGFAYTEDGFIEYAGGTVDENGFLYHDDAGRFDNLEGRGRDFPSDPFLHDDEDDGIEWQTSVQVVEHRSLSPPLPLSPTSMDALIPPRPRSLPGNHSLGSSLSPVSEEEDFDGHEERGGPKRASDLGSSSLGSGQSMSTNSSGSSPNSDDDEDEFEFDQLRMPRDANPHSLEGEEEEQDDDDDDEEFFADITHITHFADGIEDGLGRCVQAQEARGKGRLEQGSDDVSIHHRQRKRRVHSGVTEIPDEEEPPSPVTSDGGSSGSKSEGERANIPLCPSSEGRPAKRTRNHQRQWQALSLDPASVADGQHSDESDSASPVSSAVEASEEDETGRGVRISLEVERPTPIRPSGAKLQLRTRTRSMYTYKRLSPISPSRNRLPSSPILGRRAVSAPVPLVPSQSADRPVDVYRQPYVPYSKTDINPSEVMSGSSASLTQDSLLCQPIRFSHSATLSRASYDLKVPTVKLVTKKLSASPPPPSPPSLMPSTPRLRISVQSKECERVGIPDVPRSPSPTSPPTSRSPSPPLLSPTASLGESIMSTQTSSSAGPVTPTLNVPSYFPPVQSAEDVDEKLDIDQAAWDTTSDLQKASPEFPFRLDEGLAIGMNSDVGGGEEFTLAMDVQRDRRKHSHHQAKRQRAKVDEVVPQAKIFSGTPPATAAASLSVFGLGNVFSPLPPNSSVPVVVKGTTTTKSAMRRKGVDIAFFDPPSPSSGTIGY